MNRIKLVFMSVFMLLALSLSTGSTLAKEPVSEWSNPITVRNLVNQLDTTEAKAQLLWAELPTQAKEAVSKYLKVDQIVTEVIEGSGEVTALGCRTVTVARSGYNIYGWTLWTYFQKINWCYDGAKITSKNRTRWGEVYAPLWEFAGHIGNSEQGGVNQWSYRAWTQGEFKYCVAGTCIQNVYPWIDMTVYGDGTIEWSTDNYN